VYVRDNIFSRFGRNAVIKLRKTIVFHYTKIPYGHARRGFKVTTRLKAHRPRKVIISLVNKTPLTFQAVITTAHEHDTHKQICGCLRIVRIT